MKFKTRWKWGAWSHKMLLSLKDNPSKKLTCHDKSGSHKDAINSLTNVEIKDALEKTNAPTIKEKSKATDLYERITSENDKTFI